MNDSHHHSDHQLLPSILEHAKQPRNLGELLRPDAVGEYTHDCGDSIKVFLSIRGEQIEAVRYLPQSCVNTLACISMASTMIEGLTPIEARRAIRAEAISTALGGLPDHELHCAEIAARALWAALDDYIVNQREPWKRLYR